MEGRKTRLPHLVLRGCSVGSIRLLGKVVLEPSIYSAHGVGGDDYGRYMRCEVLSADY